MDRMFLTLANGNQIPCIGLGTDDVFYVNPPHTGNNKLTRKICGFYNRKILKPYLNEQMARRFVKAIHAGYRLFDTSAAYDNEESIGKAIKCSGIPRQDLFITTRCTNRMQYDRTVRDGFYKSLEKFGLDYIDLYMFHWPVKDYFLSTWKEMEKLYEEGVVRNLGVANCHRHHIEEILEHCHIKPVLNQVEIHPLFTQKPLIEYCKSKGIQVEAYSPLARNDDRLRRNRVIGELSKKYNKTRTQIIIRWHIDNGIIPIPRSMNVERMVENINVLDFSLSEQELYDIDRININSRLRYDPDNCDFTLL